jgi:hypothetical protein
MGRERCLFCERFIFDGEDTTRPAELGLTVHRHCYLRDAGLEGGPDAGEDSEPPNEESEDSPFG